MRRTIHLLFANDRRMHRLRPLLRRARPLAMALLLLVPFALPHAAACANPPRGEWLLDDRVVVQVYPCSAMMCGRIRWLKVPRNPQGQLDQDGKNPNPTLRTRRPCGLTILWNLQPDGPDRWKAGWFYNRDDGKTYRVTAHMVSVDKMVARIYVGVPLFGKTKVLTRISEGTPAGEC
jgi:uncharacterized protein (DUF2147 family)